MPAREKDHGSAKVPAPMIALQMLTAVWKGVVPEA